MNTVAVCDNHSVQLSHYGFTKQNNTESLLKPRNPLFPGLVSAPAQQSIKHYTLLANGRRFIDGNLPLSDILPNLPSEIYALVKKGIHGASWIVDTAAHYTMVPPQHGAALYNVHR